LGEENGQAVAETLALRKFIIERDIPKVGTFEREQLWQAAAKSNDVLRQLGPDMQWVRSYVADHKTLPRVLENIPSLGPNYPAALALTRQCASCHVLLPCFR
jgi:Protein of unknown function (DUF4242)